MTLPNPHANYFTISEDSIIAKYPNKTFYPFKNLYFPDSLLILNIVQVMLIKHDPIHTPDTITTTTVSNSY